MLTFVPHKISENYKKVEFYRVNKELCDSKVYNELSPTAILLYSLLCDRLSLAYTNIVDNKISKTESYCDEDEHIHVIFTRINFDENIVDYIYKYYRGGFIARMRISKKTISKKEMLYCISFYSSFIS